MKKIFPGFKNFVFKILDSHHDAPIIHSSKRHLGIILTLVGYILYAFYTIFFQIEAFRGKIVNSAYSSFFELAVLHFVMLVTFFVFCIAKGVKYFKCQNIALVIFRAILAIALLVAYSYSRVWTDNVDNSMLYSTDALWLVIIYLILRIQIPVLTWIGVILGTGGIFFVYILNNTHKDLVGFLFGILSGILLSIVVFITRGKLHQDLDPLPKIRDVELRCMGKYQEKFRKELKLHLEK